MNFVSMGFLAFLAVIFILYFVCPKRFRYLVLLIGSLVFYYKSGLKVLLMVMATALISYVGAFLIDRVDLKQNKKKRRLILTCFAVLILGFLIFTKLVSFNHWSIPGLVIPVGISYYTFSIISYLADVYWKKDKPEKNFLKYLLFVTYFPKILQGPISRRRLLGKQLSEGHPFEYKRVCFGLQLMLWGYFKKIVIADRLTMLVSEITGNWEMYSGSMLLLSLVLAAVQLYCDFSGYMDIACGISEVFGVNLEKNFDHPFFAKSAAEFWRRWHITLGTWFKDYVYMPLVISPNVMKISKWVRKHMGVRAGKAVMTIIPSAVVWILTGLWHGTGAPYLVWGIYWGVIIIFSTVYAPEIKKLNKSLGINTESASWKMFQMVRTFFLFVFGRLLTVPNNLAVSVQYLKRMIFSFQPWNLMDGTIYNLGVDVKDLSILVISIAILWMVSLSERNGSVREKIANWNLVFRWAFYCLAVVTVLVIGIYGAGYDASAFVYMNY